MITDYPAPDLSVLANWLQTQISEMEDMCDDIPFGLDTDDERAMLVCKIALAVLAAEPEYQMSKKPGIWIEVDKEEALKNAIHGYGSRVVYTDPLTNLANELRQFAENISGT